MKVWVTKYALTQGIFETEVEVCEDININMVKEINVRYPASYHGEGKEWHKTKEEAVKRAESMKEAKIKSLTNQIKKLEALKF